MKHAVFALALAVLGAHPAAAADRRFPDWPCQQLKVPELALGQVWSGPPLDQVKPAEAPDADTADLAARLVARRTPLEEAKTLVEAFATKAGADRDARLARLFLTAYDAMTRQRSEVQDGLERLDRKLKTMAEKIRDENASFQAMQDKSDADEKVVAAAQEALAWDLRVFDDRRQSVTYACEVPALIEARLYAIGKLIAADMTAPK